LRRPTYLQMSGCVAPLGNFLVLRDGRPRKQGPMRIEMAIAACGRTTTIAEFPEPIVRIYGRPNSDRANYGRTARREDLHLAAWLARYTSRHPSALGPLLAGAGAAARDRFSASARTEPKRAEDWVVRSNVEP
jgi:hypothetical protein